jgi:hypothetical protein
MKKAGLFLLGAGLLGLAMSYYWWHLFSDKIQKHLGLTQPFSLDCMAYKSGECHFAYSVSTLGGEVAYNPAIFWASAALLLVGMIAEAIGS